MRAIAVTACLAIAIATPVGSIEFLGVELCADHVDTGVILPAESPLSLESVEVGRHGGLVMLLHSKKGDTLAQVDELMAPFAGGPGTGDERKLEWTGDQITGYAQVIRKGYVALAVTAAQGCTPEPEAVPGAAPEESAPPAASDESAPAPEASEQPVPQAAVVATAEPEPVLQAAVAATAEPEPEPAEDFTLRGRLKHSAAEDGWVDVMGVVANRSGESYAVASFDISLYDAKGELICVDTVSVNQVRDGQERAFRGSIRCADYDADAVTSWKLQFAGAH